MTTMREPTKRHLDHIAMVRNVWACLTTHPNATLDEMVTATGIPQTQVQLALIELERIGYVRRTARTARSAVVVVPLISRLPADNELDEQAYQKAKDESNDA